MACLDTAADLVRISGSRVAAATTASAAQADPADLALTATVNNPTPNLADQVTFTVTNLGPDAATGVTVSDPVPAALTFVSATSSQGSYDSGTGVWTVGTVATGTPRTMTVTATVTSLGATDTATVSHSDQPDRNPVNNRAAATVRTQQADLLVTKSVSNPTPSVGDTIDYRVTVVNGGPDAATNVSVSDALPSGVAFKSATPSQGSYDAGTGVWTVGTVPVGTGLNLTISATVSSPADTVNTATVQADQFDPDPANNAATTSTDPRSADVALLATVDHPAPNVGGTVSFVVTAGNSGPASATGVQVQDALPAGLTFVSATASQGSYNSGTGVWTVGTIATGTTRTLTITATVASQSPATDAATVAHADQADPNPGNNDASATVTPQQADLVLGEAVSDPSPALSGTITYTVSLGDLGPDGATNVTVADPLPVGLTFVSAAPSQGTYDSGAGVWTAGTVSPNAAATLSLTAKVASGGPKVTTASVSHADQFDPATANNAASVTVTPSGSASASPSASLSDSPSPSATTVAVVPVDARTGDTVGRLPTTGEDLRTPLFLTGGAIVLGVLLLVLAGVGIRAARALVGDDAAVGQGDHPVGGRDHRLVVAGDEHHVAGVGVLPQGARTRSTRPRSW